MKKLIFTGLVLALISCKNDVPSAPMEPPAVPATPAPSVPEKPKPELPKAQDATSVQIGSDGVSVESKNEKKHTDVSLKNGKAAVDIQTK